MKISIADLNERIQLIFFDTERNERGDIITVREVTRCRVWAKVFASTAKITDDTPAHSNTVTYRVTIRHRDDILPDDEIIWRERRLKLISPPFNLDGKRIFTAMDCEEVIADGAS